MAEGANQITRRIRLKRAETYVSAMQFREGARTDKEVAALNGPSPDGILGAASGSAAM